MAKHIVKCVYCGKSFDTNKESFKKINTRYAHEECAKEHEKEELAKNELYEYIYKLFNIEKVSTKIGNQIRRFINELNYTYSGIHGTLVYIYEIQGSSIEKANGGIAFVEYKYVEASNYWKRINEARTANKDKSITNFVDERIVTITPPQSKRPLLRTFDLGGIEDEE